MGSALLTDPGGQPRSIFQVQSSQLADVPPSASVAFVPGGQNMSQDLIELSNCSSEWRVGLDMFRAPSNSGFQKLKNSCRNADS